jgi:hypothetical protein
MKLRLLDAMVARLAFSGSKTTENQPKTGENRGVVLTYE